MGFEYDPLAGLAYVYEDPLNLIIFAHLLIIKKLQEKSWKGNVSAVISYSTQLYLFIRPEDLSNLTTLHKCVTEISNWMSKDHLQLHHSKSEVLVFPFYLSSSWKWLSMILCHSA